MVIEKNHDIAIGVAIKEGVSKFCSIVKGMYIQIENIPGKIPEIISLLLYVCTKLFISHFHEPWFDEAVAWMIARSSSLEKIIFEIPHYEGHPQLWHLILLPFAKLGAPYEISLILINLIFTTVAVALLLFKSPFPRIIKLIIPFTYFFFYQYGVITRPYCVMILAFILLAITHKNRNEKPGRYILVHMLLCSTSAYGIIFSGGIALSWLWEICNKKHIFAFLKNFVKDKRCWWLTLLLVYAIFLIMSIMPYGDTWAINNVVLSEDNTNNITARLIYAFLALPADSICTNVFNFDTCLSLASFGNADLCYACIFTAIIVISILWIGIPRKAAKFFFIPYIIFGIFISTVYFSMHHIGIFLFFMLFWLWIALDIKISKKKQCNHIKSKAVADFSKIIKDQCPWIFPLLKCVAICTVSYMLIVSVYWSISAGYNEIKFVYSSGRNEAEFIKENNMEQYNILASWYFTYDDNHNINTEDMNTSMITSAYTILPYFDNNIFYNVADGTDKNNYPSHKSTTVAEDRINIENWKKCGYPDIIVNEVPLELMFDEDELSIDSYTAIFRGYTSRIWKDDTPQCYTSYIFMRNDLYDENTVQKKLDDFSVLEAMYK